MFTKIIYKDLNSRQKENYNFHQLSAVLAEYGYNSMWLNDDWQGADFIACHIDGNTFLKVQLKGCLTFNKKYNGKNIYIAFRYSNQWYIYPHDVLQKNVLGMGKMSGTLSWDERGGYSWPSIPKDIKEHLIQYTI